MGGIPIEIAGEQEIQGGWAFEARIGGRPRPCVIRLSWADYDLWSADAADPPHAVALAVARFMLARLGADEAPATIDAAALRRRFSDADREIPKLIA